MRFHSLYWFSKLEEPVRMGLLVSAVLCLRQSRSITGRPLTARIRSGRLERLPGALRLVNNFKQRRVMSVSEIAQGTCNHCQPKVPPHKWRRLTWLSNNSRRFQKYLKSVPVLIFQAVSCKALTQRAITFWAYSD